MQSSVHGTTMCAQLVGELMLVVHSPAPPDSKEWSAYCDYASAARRRAGGRLMTLVLSEHDAGPNAGQRAEYQQKVAGTGNRIAVLTSGKVTRAILTAMSWFNPDIAAFELTQVHEALDYLGSHRSSELMKKLHEFKSHLRLAS